MKGDGLICTTQQLYNNYKQSCLAQASEPVSEISFKRCVNSVYKISPVKTRSNNSDITVYKGIKYVQAPCDPSPPTTSHSGNDISSSTELPMRWFFVSKADDTQIVGHKTDVYFEKIQIMIEVHFTSDGSVTLYVGKKSVDPTNIGLPSNVNSCHLSINNYLQLISKCRICLGKEVPKTEPKCICVYTGETKSYRKVSLGCSVLMSLTTKSKTCHCCFSHHISSSTETYPSDETPEETPNIHHPSNIPQDPFAELFPNISDILSDLLHSQSRCCQSEAKGLDARCHRWPRSVISLALSLWITSPAAYRILSQTLYLPCEKLLQSYKNSVDKSPGINMSMCRWLYEECERTGTPKEGGVLFDEMHIQPGVQVERYGEGLKLFGYVDFGPNNNGIDSACKDNQFTLATTILQFVFLAFNGLRFPFAYVLNRGLIAGQLTSLFWDIVRTLHDCDFHISFVCMDGASVNRAFINIISSGCEPIARNIVTLNESISCIMDFSHVMKKIRNSFSSSGNSPSHKRNIIHPRGFILWEYFISAYQWDVKTNFLRLHRKLTCEHFFLNCTLKMRNHLAEEVLNSDMLLLFKEYQKHIPNPDSLNAIIEVLEVTSPFISIFRSHEPIRTMQDDRITTLSHILGYFSDWMDLCLEKRDNSDRKQNFITSESFQDFYSCIKGFINLCEYRTSVGKIVTPCLINTDVVENVFCQQRCTYNGANTNPDASHYR